MERFRLICIALAVAGALGVVGNAGAGANDGASCVGLGASSAAGQPGTTAFVVDYFKSVTSPQPLGSLLSEQAQKHAGSVPACDFPLPPLP